jgi:hypothetical protein
MTPTPGITDRCPRCGSPSLARILYGFPAFTRRLEEDLDAGRVVLGGCVIGEDQPTLSCGACEIVIWPDGHTMADADWR